jgi:hypothetical protein
MANARVLLRIQCWRLSIAARHHMYFLFVYGASVGTTRSRKRSAEVVVERITKVRVHLINDSDPISRDINTEELEIFERIIRKELKHILIL